MVGLLAEYLGVNSNKDLGCCEMLLRSERMERLVVDKVNPASSRTPG